VLPRLEGLEDRSLLSPAPLSADTPVPADASGGDLTGIQKIQHVIIIMQENRSFDSYFGTFPGADGIPMQNGVPTVSVPDPMTGGVQVPFHTTNDYPIGGPHAAPDSPIDVNNGAMNGFVARLRNDYEFAPHMPFLQQQPQPDVMGHYDGREIPNYWSYAQNFVLQDEMFASAASWSRVTHLFLVSGWSAYSPDPNNPMSSVNDIGLPSFPSDPGPPIYAWTDLTYLLYKNNVSWSYFFDPGSQLIDPEEGYVPPTDNNPDSPTGATLGIWNPLPLFTDVNQDQQLGNIQPDANFFQEAAAGTLPAVSWVTPSAQNSDHPISVHPGAATRVSDGQAWVTSLINSVMAGPDWNSCAIFVAWDDWGGFYDHVVPPVVDQNGYGLRVPGFMVSPYAKQGYIDSQTLSFDAYLKFIEDDFLGGQRLDPQTDGRPDSRPDVRENASILGDLANEFDFTQAPRPPMLLLPYPQTDLVENIIPMGIAAPNTSDLSGIVFNSAVASEFGVAGQTIYLDLHHDGQFDPGDPFTTTDPTGTYLFQDVLPGNYTVREVTAEDEVGLGNSLDSNLVTVAAGTNNTGENFTNEPLAQATGEISGTVLNGGELDTPGLPGQTVFLDLNQNGQLDPGEPSTTTDSSGSYTFTDLFPGTYLVETVPPANEIVLPPATNGIPVTVTAQTNSSGQNFTSAPLDPPSTGTGSNTTGQGATNGPSSPATGTSTGGSSSTVTSATVPATGTSTGGSSSTVTSPTVNPTPRFTVGMVDPATATWYLRSSNSAGAADAGLFQFGLPGWIPVVGDWGGNGHSGVGVFDPSTGTWYLRNETSAGPADAGVFLYGLASWKPVVGDWGGNGHSGVGVFDPSTGTWYLRNETSAGPADAGVFAYGPPSWKPIVGDWDGNGTTTVGVVDPATATWYLRNSNSAGPADFAPFQYGISGWTPNSGDFPPSTPARALGSEDLLATGSQQQDALDLLFTGGL
jgi:phospholipase C